MTIPVVRFEPVDRHADAGLLTAYELGRRDRLVRATDRAAYVAAHVLVRRCVAELTGLRLADIHISQVCPTCGVEPGHGVPRVSGHPDLQVSLSHSHHHVAAAAAKTPIGIDVETIDAGGRPDVVGQALSAAEQAWVGAQPNPHRAFLRLWVRKEAWIKCGNASLDDLAAIDVLAEDAAEPDQRAFQEWSIPDAVGAWTTSPPLRSNLRTTARQ
ncbi:MAG: 4'-phosphopantetheinyl transferase family protein [Cumulibacter sp.]